MCPIIFVITICTQGRLDLMFNAFLQLSGVFLEFTLGIIREVVKSGMANAKAKEICIGRPKHTKDDMPAIFYRHYPAYGSSELNSRNLHACAI